MLDLEISRDLHGMANRMPKVELRTVSLLEGVAAHKPDLDGQRAAHEARERRKIGDIRKDRLVVEIPQTVEQTQQIL